MSGTTGLGQNQQVFNFEGIADYGMQIDAMQQAKKEKKSAKFQAANKDLMNEVDSSGIRDIDMPYINGELNKFMELSSKAIQSENPADAAAARAAKSELSKKIELSKSYNKSWINGMSQTKQSKGYAEEQELYDNRMQWYKENTAMNKENNGYVGDAGYYHHQELTDYAPKDIISKASEAVGAVKQASFDRVSLSDAEGGTSSTRLNEKKAMENINLQWEKFLTGENAQALMFEDYLIMEYGGRSKFVPDEVGRIKQRYAYGEELKKQFTSLEALENSPEFKNSPMKLAEARKAFTMEEDMVANSKKKFENAIWADIQKATDYSKSEKDPNAGRGASTGDDYGVNNATTFTQLIGDEADISLLPKEMQDKINSGSSFLGMSSTKGANLESIGKGKNAVYYEGITAVLPKNVKVDDLVDEDGNIKEGALSKVDWLLNTRVPAEDELTQIINLQEEGKSPMEIFNLIDFTLSPQPLSKFQGDIPQGELMEMRRQALMQAVGLKKANRGEEAGDNV